MLRNMKAMKGEKNDLMKPMDWLSWLAERHPASLTCCDMGNSQIDKQQTMVWINIGLHSWGRKTPNMQWQGHRGKKLTMRVFEWRRYVFDARLTFFVVCLIACTCALCAAGHRQQPAAERLRQLQLSTLAVACGLAYRLWMWLAAIAIMSNSYTFEKFSK